MRSRILNQDARTTYMLVFEEGDEVVEGMTRFANETGLDAAEFTGLGALSKATLGFWNLERQEYEEIPVDEQVEVITLIGNVTSSEGKAKVHPHIVLGKQDGTAHGGHLLKAYVRPTLEVVVTESPAHLRRRMDEAAGLPLIDLTL